MTLTPTAGDRFTFGPWAAGWPAGDPFAERVELAA